MATAERVDFVGVVRENSIPAQQRRGCRHEWFGKGDALDNGMVEFLLVERVDIEEHTVKGAQRRGDVLPPALDETDIAIRVLTPPALHLQNDTFVALNNGVRSNTVSLDLG